jgi:N-methylhydantoinase B
VTWRYFVKHEIFRQIQHPPVNGSDGVDDVYKAYTQVTDRFADLPKAS